MPYVYTSQKTSALCHGSNEGVQKGEPLILPFVACSSSRADCRGRPGSRPRQTDRRRIRRLLPDSRQQGAPSILSSLHPLRAWGAVKTWPGRRGEQHGLLFQERAGATPCHGCSIPAAPSPHSTSATLCVRHTRRHHHGHTSSHQMLRLLLQSPHRHHHRHQPLPSAYAHF